MSLSEAEIQVLAQIRGAEAESEPTDRQSIEARGERYWNYLEDWSGAFTSLANDGLIEADQGGYRLTEKGRPFADTYYQERPDMYWYFFQQLYGAAFESKTHREFCRRMYGQDLCQENMTDMSILDGMLEKLALKSGDKVLDLGCGSGGVAAYASENHGLSVTGIDYSDAAVKVASGRAIGKSDRLSFHKGDLNTLEVPANSYDAAYSVDSIYWVADATDTVRRITHGIKPGGKFAVIIALIADYCDSPEELELHGTFVADAFKNLQLEYEGYDYTEEFLDWWPRIKENALALRPDYEREGNAFIADVYIKEADEEFLPAIAAGDVRKYLYIATV
jgi:ubiquinone/menaquinone biosynthesis C-methylase UbiE